MLSRTGQGASQVHDVGLYQLAGGQRRIATLVRMLRPLEGDVLASYVSARHDESLNKSKE
jgi:hypothetical protein